MDKKRLEFLRLLLNQPLKDKDRIMIMKESFGICKKTYYNDKFFLREGRAKRNDKGYENLIKSRKGCYFCYSKKNVLIHHLQYNPEKTIKLCPKCHKKLHLCITLSKTGNSVIKNRYGEKNPFPRHYYPT